MSDASPTAASVSPTLMTTASVVTGPPPQPTAHKKHPVVQVLEVLGSLRITVTLFALSLVLVFFGTLAQIDSGIWTVVGDYFRSFLLWIKLQLLVQFGQVFFGLPRSWRLADWCVIPFPGGWMIGALLLLNLACAYGLRVPGYLKQWPSYALMAGVLLGDGLIGYVAVKSLDQWWFLIFLGGLAAVNVVTLIPFRRLVFFPGNRIGILTVHLGIVLMLVGEFITGVWAVEGTMHIRQGQTTSALLHTRFSELAVVDAVDRSEDKVTVVPGSILKEGGTIREDNLPFDIEVLRWMANSTLSDLKPGDTNPATAGHGTEVIAREVGEVSGVASSQAVETPSVYVKLTGKDGKELGTYLFSTRLPADPIKLGGKEYEVSLRFKHTYKPYSLRLEEFTFDRYPGTQKAKNFASRVRLIDPERGDDREVTISMNNPLRHRGDTFFQAGWDKEDEQGTYLQVVKNPAWQLPYWSCAIVAAGMLIHFGLNLVNFLGRRAGE